MAGHGPAPKDPARRAGHSKDPHPQTVLRAETATAPRLPDGYAKDPNVRRWWEMWKSSPQSEHFSSTDWHFLLETVPLVAAFWAGDLKQAAELRLRVAKFGATPEDRARLRMQFAQADELDSKRPAEASPARDRYGDLRVVRGDAVAAG